MQKIVHSKKEAVMAIHGKEAKIIDLDYATAGGDFEELAVKGKAVGISVIFRGQTRNGDREKLDEAQQAAEKAVKALQELTEADNPLLAQFGVDLVISVAQVKDKLELLQTLVD